jgi:hypothetical protein
MRTGHRLHVGPELLQAVEQLIFVRGAEHEPLRPGGERRRMIRRLRSQALEPIGLLFATECDGHGQLEHAVDEVWRDPGLSGEASVQVQELRAQLIAQAVGRLLAVEPTVEDHQLAQA